MLSLTHSHTHKLQELSINLETNLFNLSWQELLSQHPQTPSLFIILSAAYTFASCMLFISITMRVSKSFVRLAPGPRTGGSPHDQPPRRRSSFDNLVIPNRTRLPSSRISQVEPIDLAVARNLLDAAAQGPDMAASGASDPSEPRDSYDSSFTESDQQGTQSSSAGEFYIRQHSRTTSWAGNELLPDSYEDQPRTGSSSSVDWRHYELGMSHDGPHDFATGGSFVNLHMPLSTRVGNVDILRAEPDKAASRYNALATANGLAPFQVTQDYGQCPSLSHFILSDYFFK